MALRIYNNLSSLNSQRVLEENRMHLGRSISRIGSGEKNLQAADDSASTAISTLLKSDIRAYQQGARNLNDGLALVNTAEGALNEVAGILIRQRELATQSATGTIGQTERETIHLEFVALRSELDRIAKTSEFNGQKLTDGSLAADAADAVVLQIGNDSNVDNRVNLNQEVNLTAVTAEGLGIANSTIGTQESANEAIGALNQAISELIEVRGRLGAVQNRFVRALNNLNSTVEGLTSAVSRINDADLGVELSELTKNQILVQSATAMIAQSNLTPQTALTLLTT